MIKEETIEFVEKGIEEEIKNAKTYGEKYNSLHEFYAILKEEVEEMKFEGEGVCDNLVFLWNLIKKENDEKIKEYIKIVEVYAEKAALEAIQVCAVCRKALDE